MQPEYRESEFIHDVHGDRRAVNHAFEWLFRAYFERLYNFARRFIQSKAEAEDVAMNAFGTLYKTRDRFQSLPAARSFLYIAVKNNCFDCIKTRRNRAIRETRFQRQLAQEPVLAALTQDDKSFEIQMALERLPEQCKKVFQLIYINGLPYREAAKTLGITLNSVKSQRRIGLNKLRSIFFCNLSPEGNFASFYKDDQTRYSYASK